MKNAITQLEITHAYVSTDFVQMPRLEFAQKVTIKCFYFSALLIGISVSVECGTGYRVIGTDKCVDIDECLEKTAQCGTNEQCFNTDGGYKCLCNKGYEMNTQLECVDINECENNASACVPLAICTNIPGSYQCTCKPGYKMVGDQCIGNICIDFLIIEQ